MTRQNLVDFNFADPFYQYPERRRRECHGNRKNRNKKVNYNIAKIISNLKSIYTIHPIRWVLKSLWILLKVLQRSYCL